MDKSLVDESVILKQSTVGETFWVDYKNPSQSGWMKYDGNGTLSKDSKVIFPSLWLSQVKLIQNIVYSRPGCMKYPDTRGIPTALFRGV